MSETKKNHKLSIKLQLFIAMISITLVFVVLTWTFQFAFLNIIYRVVKENYIETAAEDVKDETGYQNLNEFLEKISSRYDVSISAFRFTSDTEFETVHFGEFSISNEGNQDGEELIKAWLVEVNESENGIYIAESNGSELIYATTIRETLSNGTIAQCLVVLNTVATPQMGTVWAIRAMLLLLSIVLIASAVVISYFLSKSISRPIETMSNKAKNLTLFDYDVTFNDKRAPRDIRELASALNSATNELKKLSSTQKELIANISHDLRTPLTMISGYSEVMRDFPDERSPENMQIIIDETARLNSLVNDLLTVSKLQSGTQIMDSKTISITKCIEDTVKRYEKLLEHRDYKINFESDGEVFVIADETRLLQVVYNLINNAINYTGDDKTVTVKQEVNGSVVRISVIDTGEGISEENLPLIWDRYYKVDKVHKRAILGTGLGLSIVKNILLLHGSRFGVSSELGKGSTFWFEFKIEK